ncbi:hypothetical protein RI367_004013 [Sorochytrium milnesiophthora]
MRQHTFAPHVGMSQTLAPPTTPRLYFAPPTQAALAEGKSQPLEKRQQQKTTASSTFEARFSAKYQRFRDGLADGNLREAMAALFSVHKRLVKVSAGPIGSIMSADDRTALVDAITCFLCDGTQHARHYDRHASSSQRQRRDVSPRLYTQLALQEVEDVALHQLPQLGIQPSLALVEELAVRWCVLETTRPATPLKRIMIRALELGVDISVDSLYKQATKAMLKNNLPEMAYLFYRRSRRAGQSFTIDELLALCRSLLRLKSFWAILLVAELARQHGNTELRAATVKDVTCSASPSTSTRRVVSLSSVAPSAWSIAAVIAAFNLLIINTRQHTAARLGLTGVLTDQLVHKPTALPVDDRRSETLDALVSARFTYPLLKHALQQPDTRLLSDTLSVASQNSCTSADVANGSAVFSAVIEHVWQRQDARMLHSAINGLLLQPVRAGQVPSVVTSHSLPRLVRVCQEMQRPALVEQMYETLFVERCLFDRPALRTTECVNAMLCTMTSQRHVSHLYGVAVAHNVPLLPATYHHLLRSMHERWRTSLDGFTAVARTEALEQWQRNPRPKAAPEAASLLSSQTSLAQSLLSYEHLFRQFLHSPLNPSTSLYSSFLSLFINLQRFDLAEEVVSLIRQHHESANGPLKIDTQLYNTLLYGYICNGQFTSAAKVWAKMLREGMVDTASYNVVLTHIASSVWQARRKPCPPTGVRSASLASLDMLYSIAGIGSEEPAVTVEPVDAVASLMEVAITLLDRMGASNALPDARTYATLVRIVAAASFSEAHQVLDDVVEKLTAGSTTADKRLTPAFNQLLHALTLHAQATPSERLFRHMLLHSTVDATSFECMMRLYNEMERARRNVKQPAPFALKWGVWRQLLARAQQPNCRPNANTLSLLLASHPAQWKQLALTCRSILEVVIDQLHLGSELDGRHVLRIVEVLLRLDQPNSRALVVSLCAMAVRCDSLWTLHHAPSASTDTHQSRQGFLNRVLLASRRAHWDDVSSALMDQLYSLNNPSPSLTDTPSAPVSVRDLLCEVVTACDRVHS